MSGVTPGVYFDMPAAEYHALPYVSSSALRVFARSPWHYKHRQPVTPTRSMLLGTLSHCAVLEPDAVSQRYVTVPQDAPRRPSALQRKAKNPSDDTRAAIAWWDAFEASAAGKELADAEAIDLTRQQIVALRRQPELARLLSDGSPEVSVIWQDEESGLMCKARIDWVAMSGGMLDLKTTADESPSAFGRQCARMKWHLQWAHYADGAARFAMGNDMLFAAVTNAAPVLAVPYRLTDEIQAQAIDERRELLNRLAWCIRENEWPAYGDGVQLLDFPAYAKRDNELEFSYDV